jgi:hypothetical protein
MPEPESLVSSVSKALESSKKPDKPSAQKSLYDDWDTDYPYRRTNMPAWLGPYEKGGNTFHPQKPTTQSSSKTYGGRRVAVVEKDGSRSEFTVPYDLDGWYDLAKYVWPLEGQTIVIPREHCQFSYKDPTFNACVYTATNDYMQARWGRKLDDSDRRWLAAHPFATDSGVPQEYTATCVDQLVLPYGMRVSRVRLRRGSLVLGDSIMGWIFALGCNPFALSDRSTSNADAAERMGIPVAQADQLWRVEFHDQPLPCSVVGERGWSSSSSSGVTTGSGGGHARYLAPRAFGGDWFISLQLAPDYEVSHLVAPPNPEYTPRKGDETLLAGLVTDPDGKLIAEKKNNKWVRFGDTAPAVTQLVGASGEVAPPESFRPQGQTVEEAAQEEDTDADEVLVEVDLLTYPMNCRPIEWNRREIVVGVNDDTEICLMCGNEVFALMKETDVCRECADDVWDDFYCPHCHSEFRHFGSPYPIGVDAENYEWGCPVCKETFLFPVAHTLEADAYFDQAWLSFCVFFNVKQQDLEEYIDGYSASQYDYP